MEASQAAEGLAARLAVLHAHRSPGVVLLQPLAQGFERAGHLAIGQCVSTCAGSAR